MQTNQILEKTSNHSPEKATLLSIDMDERYLDSNQGLPPVVPQEFQDKYMGFLNSIRDNFNVVHVWHYVEHKERLETHFNRVGTTETCHSDTDLTYLFNNDISPKSGEMLLGKKNYSAFEQTDLSQHLDTEQPVFIMGTLGKNRFRPEELYCIDRTIIGGLSAGYRMIAITDMINQGYSERNYPKYGRIPTTDSTQITNALHITTP